MSVFKSRLSLSRVLLWFLVTVALAFYAFMVFDFLAHPFAAGSNATLGTPYLFRWLSFVTGTFTVIIALFIMLRVRGNIVGPLLLIFGVGAAGWSGRLESASLNQAEWFPAMFALYFNVLAVPSLIAMLFYFPTGHAYPPSLGRWLPVFFICMSIEGMFASLVPAQQSGVPIPLYGPIFETLANITGWVYVITLLAAIVNLVIRYRHSGFQERMQLKWVVWLGGLLIVLSLPLSIVPANAININNMLSVKVLIIYRVIVYILWQGFAAAAFGIAILRHRLWDIDIIIRRTLVYGALTLTLVAVYLVAVLLLQQVFVRLTGQKSPIAIVISTLAIAALFTPLRQSIQRDIDRRFYRKKYDAARTLEAFNTKVREDVELDQLTAHLLAVVEETLQPESTTLWLKPVRGGSPGIPDRAAMKGGLR
jgi:hypothetical protein